jgi:hypothetical protein
VWLDRVSGGIEAHTRAMQGHGAITNTRSTLSRNNLVNLGFVCG